MSLEKVLILYYSGSGNTKKMAKEIAEAMKSSAINVTVEDVGKFDISLLPNYSGGKLKRKVAGIFTSAGTSTNGKDCLKMLEVALGFHHGMKVVPGILRVDGESDKEVEKRCQEYGKRLVKEIEK